MAREREKESVLFRESCAALFWFILDAIIEPLDNITILSFFEVGFFLFVKGENQ
jgi:hypothetical protein